ncbi:ATP-binding protein [Streptomyces albogriseolus]|uniref:ATP-binding protein n=1 Tax=Streptomyces albogriseolus TaxID=1887 RepID=UPI001676F7F9|nr:ATP-binding protein [Streptomyces viridodiastaticus]GHG23138.1 ATP-binding protein [Streptomyces viridodiastaticus]
MTTEIPPFERTADRTPSGEESFSLCFTSTPRGARLARRLASHRLDAWGFPYASEVNDTVTLVVAELAANAVTHGRVPGRGVRLALALSAARDLVRVEVTDIREDRPPADAPRLPLDPEAETERGLWLVSQLASRVCVVPRTDGGPGKTVRAELRL